MIDKINSLQDKFFEEQDKAYALKYPRMSQQEERAKSVGEDCEYYHCSSCGVKIDYGNVLVIGDFIFCGDKDHCSYHNNCRGLMEEVND
jgi:hypothetical protein